MTSEFPMLIPDWVLAFLKKMILFQVGAFASQAEKPMENSFVTGDVVLNLLAKDKGLVTAIEASRKSLAEFTQRLASHTKRYRDFVVVGVRQTPKGSEPVGLLVDRFENGRFYGSEFANIRHIHYVKGKESSMPSECVIDWRYTDRFVLQGGFVYQELLRRLDKETQSRSFTYNTFASSRTSDGQRKLRTSWQSFVTKTWMPSS